MALTLTAALACIERGVRKAETLGFHVAVAVVDEAGHLVACHRMDGALWVTPEIAGDLESRFAGARALFAGNVAALPDYAFVFGKGAIPLIDGGQVVGAVGVSGAVPADNDHAIADAAAGHPGLSGSR
jgi:uncharacterized protein GlcG (DUF336 family)